MLTTDESLTRCTEAFSYLREAGFKARKAEVLSLQATLRWLHREVGIEFKLDYREEYAYLLIVRLEEGKLPDGYYESHGKTCRVYVDDAIKLRNWPGDLSVVKALASRHYSDPGERFTCFAVEYARILRPLVPRILGEWQMLFGKTQKEIESLLAAGPQEFDVPGPGG